MEKTTHKCSVCEKEVPSDEITKAGDYQHCEDCEVKQCDACGCYNPDMIRSDSGNDFCDAKCQQDAEDQWRDNDMIACPRATGRI